MVLVLLTHFINYAIHAIAEVSRASLSSSFKLELESLPPTSAAAKQHSLTIYLTVQQLKGNLLNPTESGLAHS